MRVTRVLRQSCSSSPPDAQNETEDTADLTAGDASEANDVEAASRVTLVRMDVLHSLAEGDLTLVSEMAPAYRPILLGLAVLAGNLWLLLHYTPWVFLTGLVSGIVLRIAWMEADCRLHLPPGYRISVDSLGLTVPVYPRLTARQALQRILHRPCFEPAESITIPWEDIQAVGPGGPGIHFGFRVKTAAGFLLDLNLAGFDLTDCQRLLATVLVRAGLDNDEAQRGDWFVRPDKGPAIDRPLEEQAEVLPGEPPPGLVSGAAETT